MIDTTIFVGSLYEKVTTGAVTEHKHYIMSPSGRIAVLTRSTANPAADTIRYFHTDGLASITAVTNENGAIVERYIYDGWGKQSMLYPMAGPVVTNQTPTTRGFTDHEMLSDYGLIHMNGRVYDQAIGRFLSADSVVDGAHDAQGYNRYTYAANNPLKYVDPTGHEVVGWSEIAMFGGGTANSGAKSNSFAWLDSSSPSNYWISSYRLPYSPLAGSILNGNTFSSSFTSNVSGGGSSTSFGTYIWSRVKEEIIEPTFGVLNALITLPNPNHTRIRQISSAPERAEGSLEAFERLNNFPDDLSEHPMKHLVDAALPIIIVGALPASTMEAGAISEETSLVAIDKAIRRNAIEADASATGIPRTSGRYGTAAHRKFETLNNNLNATLVDYGSRFSFEVEQFRNASGQIVGRRAKGSLGVDLLVKLDGIPISGYDLKTGALWSSEKLKVIQLRFNSIPINQIQTRR